MNSVGVYLTKVITIRGATNYYLLKIIDGFLMIDAGMPHDFRRFRRKLKNLGIDISEIRYLFLTHSHADHSGFTELLLQKNDAKLIVHENTIPHLFHGTIEPESKPVNYYYKIMKRLAAVAMKHGVPPVTIDENRIIIIKEDDNKLLKNLGIEGKIITTFGHTLDSITLILRDGRGFVGDTCSNRSTFYFGKGKRPAFIIEEEMLMESWSKIKDNGVKIVCPGHGKAFPIEELK